MAKILFKSEEGEIFDTKSFLKDSSNVDCSEKYQGLPKIFGNIKKSKRS